jgi:hypothetical protein
MDKISKIRLILNKRNKSVTMQVPKKQFDKSIRDKLNRAKYAFIKFEGFE